MANLRLVKPRGEKRTFDGWNDEDPESMLREWSGPIKPILLGLPCSRCRAYYDAELKACPICGCAERVTRTACKVVIHPQARAA
jgi:hypothetical protein